MIDPREVFQEIVLHRTASLVGCEDIRVVLGGVEKRQCRCFQIVSRAITRHSAKLRLSKYRVSGNRSLLPMRNLAKSLSACAQSVIVTARITQLFLLPALLGMFLQTDLHAQSQMFSSQNQTSDQHTYPDSYSRISQLPEYEFEERRRFYLENSQEEPIVPPLTDLPNTDLHSPGDDCVDCVELPTEKPGFIKWKDTTVIGTWLSGSGNQLGVTEFDVRGTIAFPRLGLLWITPRYNMIFLDGPRQTDLPARLYTASLGFNWFQPINDRWHAMFGVSPGVYSDFQASTSEAIRITGRALAFYKWNDQVDVAMGVVYLDRQDVAILPAVGLVYQPDDDTKVELMFPKPKVSKRYRVTDTYERWLYASVEFGGGSWAIERTNGTDDILTYRDFRLISGIETIHNSGRKTFFEFAYVWSRSVEYDSGIGDYNPDDVAMVRAGFKF